MAITAGMVKELREMTGAGMMDCKKALTETNGDMDAAVEVLRKSGAAKMEKKQSRIAAEGIARVAVNGNVAVVAEVNSETDFVAKNDKFQSFVLSVAKTVINEDPKDVDDLLTKKLDGSDRTVQENLQDMVLAIGENMKIRRFERVTGIAATYIHAGGAVGVLVSFDTDEKTAAAAEFKEMGKDVAMQIAAMSPAYLDRASVPASVIEHESEIIKAQLAEDPKMAGKPDQVLAKIAEGKVGKYYKENCLLEQEFVKDGSMNVQKYVDSVAKKLGADIKVTSFIRYAKGEGLEKKEENFADEIANMVKG